MKKILSLLVVMLVALFSAFSVKAENADRAYEENVRGFIVTIRSTNLDNIPVYSYGDLSMKSGKRDYNLYVYLKPGESWTIQHPNIPEFEATHLSQQALTTSNTWETETSDLQIPFTVHYDDLQESLYTNSDGTLQVKDKFVVGVKHINDKRVTSLPVVIRDAGSTEPVDPYYSDYRVLAVEGQYLSFNDNYIPGKKITGFKFYKLGTLSKEFNESIVWDPESFDDPDAIVLYYGDPEESTFINADGWTAWDLTTLPGNNEPEETTTEETTEEVTTEATDEATEVVETVVYEERDNSAVAIITITLVALLAGGGGVAIYSAQKKKDKK